MPTELEFFDEIFDSSVERVQKPDVSFYELVEQRISTTGNDLYFIDDVKKNLDIAQQRSWQYFLYGMGNAAGLQANAELRKTLLQYP